MVSTSGAQLLPENAVRTLREQLLPITTILTPNLPEAMLLLKNAGKVAESPQTKNDVLNLAQEVQRLGPEYVLLKGGHMPLTRNGKISQSDGDHSIVLDVLCGSKMDPIEFESPYIKSKNTHGTGCSLACKSDQIFRRLHLTLHSCHCCKSSFWIANREGC